MPVLMRGERLHKAGAFKRGLRLPAIEQSGALKHAVGIEGLTATMSRSSIMKVSRR